MDCMRHSAQAATMSQARTAGLSATAFTSLRASSNDRPISSRRLRNFGGPAFPSLQCPGFYQDPNVFRDGVCSSSWPLTVPASAAEPKHSSKCQRHSARFSVDPICGPSDFDDHEASRLTLARLERSFLTESSIGPVECTGKGCRPVLRPPPPAAESTPSASVSSPSASVPSTSTHLPLYPLGSVGTAAACMEERAATYHRHQEGRQYNLPGRPNLQTEFAEFVNEVWVEPSTADKYYQSAMRQSPYDIRLLTSYAQFSWKQLHDKDQAENLYQKAIQESPDNSDALASYALFLWESESESEGEVGSALGGVDKTAVVTAA